MRWRFAIGLCLVAVLWTGAGYSQPAPAEEEIGPAVEDQPIAPVGEQEGAPAGEQDAAPEQDSALELLPAIQGIEAAIRDLIAQEDAAEREAERRRNDADLRAQQAMARWALWATLAAGASVFLTAAGVYLIYRTLLYTRDAAKYAKTAADAATEANSIFRNERRPWLFVDREVDCEFRDSGRHLQIKWHFRLKNFGLSPAIDVNLRSRLMVVGKHDDLWSIAAAFYDEGWNARESTSGVVIYPDQVSDRNYRLMGQQVRRERADNDQALLMVVATYKFAHGDGFGMEAYTFGVERDGATHKLIGHTYLRRTM